MRFGLVPIGTTLSMTPVTGFIRASEFAIPLPTVEGTVMYKRESPALKIRSLLSTSTCLAKTGAGVGVGVGDGGVVPAGTSSTSLTSFERNNVIGPFDWVIASPFVPQRSIEVGELTPGRGISPIGRNVLRS